MAKYDAEYLKKHTGKGEHEEIDRRVFYTLWGEQGEGSRGHRAVKAVSKLLEILHSKGLLSEDDVDDILGTAVDSL
jgi:hypothetical protein